ncbi:monooxygenase [Mycobacterium paraense]|nr:monooxygenase [Mycobacterium paraense]
MVVGQGAGGRCARAALQAAGVADVATLGRDVPAARFDDDTDTWVLTTAEGETTRARVVIAAGRPVQAPWLPEIPGRDGFRGESFHAAQWPPGFDATGKRVAIVGADATAGHHLPRLAASAAAVTVFAHPPRRIVDELPLPATRVRRWLGRRLRPAATSEPRVALVRSAISAVTASGIRTGDGAEHGVDAIVYGTGFAVPGRTPGAALLGPGDVSAGQLWADGTEPYFGVAVHGLPNYFFIDGPDVDAQARYIAECVGLMQRTDSTRIEVRRSSYQVFNERAYVQPAQPQPVGSAFELTAGAGRDATYEGAATLTIAGAEHPVRVRLPGHLDPIDGRYHWQGTVFGAAALNDTRTATLTVGERSAAARVVEQTPWGTHTVAGVGSPPYALR